jgi:hypothetical protein
MPAHHRRQTASGPAPVDHQVLRVPVDPHVTPDGALHQHSEGFVAPAPGHCGELQGARVTASAAARVDLIVVPFIVRPLPWPPSAAAPSTCRRAPRAWAFESGSLPAWRGEGGNTTEALLKTAPEKVSPSRTPHVQALETIARTGSRSEGFEVREAHRNPIRLRIANYPSDQRKECTISSAIGEDCDLFGPNCNLSW